MHFVNKIAMALKLCQIQLLASSGRFVVWCMAFSSSRTQSPYIMMRRVEDIHHLVDIFQVTLLISASFIHLLVTMGRPTMAPANNHYHWTHIFHSRKNIEIALPLTCAIRMPFMPLAASVSILLKNSACIWRTTNAVQFISNHRNDKFLYGSGLDMNHRCTNIHSEFQL